MAFKDKIGKVSEGFHRGFIDSIEMFNSKAGAEIMKIGWRVEGMGVVESVYIETSDSMVQDFCGIIKKINPEADLKKVCDMDRGHDERARIIGAEVDFKVKYEQGKDANADKIYTNIRLESVVSTGGGGNAGSNALDEEDIDIGDDEVF